MEENNSNIPFAAEEELLSTAIDMLSAEKEITAEESAQPVAEEAQAEKEEQATYNGLPKVESTFEDLGVSGEILKAIKEMGYSGVELAGTYGMTAVQIQEILDEVGLTLVSAHVGADLMWDDALMADYAATGMKHIAVPWFHKPTDPAVLAENIAKIRELGEHCRTFGLQMGYHNHDFELAEVPGDGRCGLEAYYEEIPADLLQTQLDLCWVKVGGKDPVEFLKLC